jgi:TPR repeat protein
MIALWMAAAHAATCEDGDPADCAARCDAGEAKACVARADHELAAGDSTTARARLEATCAAGEGCDRLGVLLLIGDGGSADPVRGLSLLDGACTAGSGLACRNLGAAADQGVGEPVDAAKATALYSRGCDLGDGPACHNLAVTILTTGGDPTEAMHRDERGCNLGFPGSCTSYGIDLASGTGVIADPARAIPFLEPGCAAGEPLGCRWLGVVLQDGVAPDDWPRAIEVFGTACDAGDVLSCTYRGSMREEGAGTTIDRTAAAADYARGCDAGLPYACARAAALDLGLHRAHAMRALRQLCTGGDAWSCDRLAAEDAE